MSERRFILGIETSNPSIGAGVAIADAGGAVLDVEPVDAGTRRSDDLMAAIDRVCARAGAKPGDLGTIAVSVGPGSYTSIRVAVTTAKLLAEATGAGVIGVPTWASVARATAVGAYPAAVCLASKGETTTAAVVAGPDDVGDRPGVIRAADLAGLGVRTVIADGHLGAAIRAEAGRLGVTVVVPVLEAETLIAFASEREAGRPDDLAPIYVREPDAVTQWRARHGDAT